MAHKRHGTAAPAYAAWWKHLRKYNKRKFWKKHRRTKEDG